MKCDLNAHKVNVCLQSMDLKLHYHNNEHKVVTIIAAMAIFEYYNRCQCTMTGKVNNLDCYIHLKILLSFIILCGCLSVWLMMILGVKWI